MVLIAPAFTSLKSAGDVTNAAYTIKGVLDTARTYAKANNTYTWVGFYEENGANLVSSPNSDTPARRQDRDIDCCFKGWTNLTVYKFERNSVRTT